MGSAQLEKGLRSLTDLLLRANSEKPAADPKDSEDLLFSVSSVVKGLKAL